jgi:hypothetical protein
MRLLGPAGGDWIEFGVISYDRPMRVLVVYAKELPVTGGTARLFLESGLQVMVLRYVHSSARYVDATTGTPYEVEPIPIVENA